jgi:hypothetical protein
MAAPAKTQAAIIFVLRHQVKETVAGHRQKMALNQGEIRISASAGEVRLARPRTRTKSITLPCRYGTLCALLTPAEESAES